MPTDCLRVCGSLACGCGSASRRKTASCSTSDATTKSSIDCKNEGSIATSTSSKRQETSSYLPLSGNQWQS
eukprot:583145-Prymnesium_polylepis.1